MLRNFKSFNNNNNYYTNNNNNNIHDMEEENF